MPMAIHLQRIPRRRRAEGVDDRFTIRRPAQFNRMERIALLILSI
jgi:hypothetical protein